MWLVMVGNKFVGNYEKVNRYGNTTYGPDKIVDNVRFATEYEEEMIAKAKADAYTRLGHGDARVVSVRDFLRKKVA